MRGHTQLRARPVTLNARPTLGNVSSLIGLLCLLAVGPAFEKLSLKDYRVDGLNPFMPGSNVNGSGVVSPSLDVFLGDRIGDYAAHIFALSAVYHW
jgi:hypothetical protein